MFELLVMLIPLPVLPEITLPVPAAFPPMVLPLALLLIVMPTLLEMADVPAALTPM